MRAFYVTDEDAVILREMTQEYRRRNRSGPGFGTVQHPHSLGEILGVPSDDFFPPEVYIAEIPAEGIPPLQLDGSSYVPGSAECDIYKIWPRSGYGTGSPSNDELISADFYIEEVFNIGSASIARDENSKFCIVLRDKFGSWFGIPNAGGKLVELCAQENASRNVPYTALLGTWNPDLGYYCYDNAPTVYAIDHRMGPPTAEVGWKGLYQVMPSNVEGHDGKIYILVSLDCELPPEGCNNCLGTGTGT